MKKKKKAFFAVLLASVLGMCGIMAMAADHIKALDAAKQGAGITIKHYGEPEDSDYSFRLKRTDKTTCTWRNTSGIQGKAPYHQKNATMERWGQIITSDQQKGKVSCYLTNTGNYKGKNTNLRITFTDWPDYRTKTGEKYYPVVGVALTDDFYGLTFSDIWYEAKMEILDDGGNPVKVDMTYRAEDLDYGQIFAVKKQDKISGVNIPEDSRAYYASQNGYHYFYADAPVDSNEYDKDSVQIQYEDVFTFSMRVGGGVAFPESFNYSEYVSEEQIEKYKKFNEYMVGEGNIDEVDAAHVTIGWIAGSAKGYGKFTAPTPKKSVSKEKIHGEDPYQYTVNWKVPECQPADYYPYMKLTDVLPEAVACDSVCVYDVDNMKDVSSYFRIQIEKEKEETISVQVKNPGAEWMYGRTFEVRIQVHKRPEYVFGNNNTVTNQAVLDVGGKDGVQKSNTVKNSFYYQILTEAVNGSITGSDLQVQAGSSKKITYAPLKGYYLKSVSVDEKSMDLKTYEFQYEFAKVNQDHKIRIVYAPMPVLTITKEVKGRWDEFGTPTFLFKISGTDHTGTGRTYYESLLIPEQFQEDGVFRKSFELHIPAGKWTVSEVEVSRYKQTGIKEIENGTLSGNKVQLNTQDHDTAKATFCNELDNYDKFSHNDLVINEFGR